MAHQGTDFFEYFGCALDSDETTNISTMTGVPSTIASGMSFSFTSGADENYSVDAINATTGTNIFTSTGEYNRAVVNTQTGLTICSTPVLGGMINGATTRSELIYEYMNYLIVDPDVPAIPDYVAVTPDPSGALSCEIEWYNPLNNFSGDPLTELLEMRLYRNDDLIYTDTDPVIGGFASYIDIPTESGLYNYMIVGYNSFGEGPGAVSSTWVGEDVPNVVENLELGEIDGEPHITWINPTTGLNGGAFNNPIVGYHIERNDGVIFEVMGIVTEFIDDTIPGCEYFQYMITPYNAIGDGGSATTPLILIGAGTVIFSDDFEAGLGNWNSIINSGTGEWLIYSEPYPNTYNMPPTSTGNVCSADSDATGSGSTTDCTLELAVPLDLTNFASVNIQFDNDFNAIGSSDYCYVDISLDGGSTWDNVLTFAGVSVEASHEIIDITAYAAGQSNVLTRFVSVQPSWDWWWTIDNVGVYGVEGTSSDPSDVTPIYTKLKGNYPNPFNPETKISFNLHEGQKVEINIYNIKGQKVKQLVKEQLAAGQHSIIWQGIDESGKSVSSGVYFYKMKTQNYNKTKKMILIK